MPRISRKIAVIIFALTTLGAALALTYVLLQLRNNPSLAPQSTAAAGFGALASRDLYPTYTKFFSELPCTGLLPKESLQTVIFQSEYPIAQTVTEAIKDKTITISDNPANAEHVKNCEYRIGEEAIVELDMFTYASSATIDNSPQDLYQRVNSTSIDNQLDLGTSRTSVYFYGSNSAKECVTNIFHFQNDFERITLTFKGFECPTLKPYAQALTTVVSDYLFAYSKGISAKGYEKLCDGWARPATLRCEPTSCVSQICQGGEWQQSEESNACSRTEDPTSSLCNSATELSDE